MNVRQNIFYAAVVVFYLISLIRSGYDIVVFISGTILILYLIIMFFIRNKK